MTQRHQPLIGVIFERDGEEVVRYFSDEQDTDTALPDDTTQDALALAGSWSDLDWNDMEESLFRRGPFI